MKQKLIKKDALVAKIAKKAKISNAKAILAYETVLLESPSFRKQSIKTVQAKKEVAVKVPGKETVKKVNISKEKAVKSGGSIEKIKIVEVKVPVPVEKLKIVEVKVPIPVIKVKEIVKEVKVIKEIPVITTKTVVKEIEVVKEVPVEVIKEVTLVREVEKVVVKEVKVKDESAIKKLNAQILSLQKKLAMSVAKSKDLSKKLAAKPKTIIKKVQVVKEVPVEIIREVEVVKQIDFASLEKMMKGMKTVEISKTVVGETRTKKEGKVVERREVKRGAKATATKKKSVAIKPAPKKAPVKKAAASKITAKKVAVKKAPAKKVVKKDDLTKIEGIGPKIAGLLHAGGISTFAALSKAKVTTLKAILDAAGPRYQMHNPGSWPKQSGLAASGKWTELEKLQDKLKGGKETVRNFV